MKLRFSEGKWLAQGETGEYGGAGLPAELCITPVLNVQLPGTQAWDEVWDRKEGSGAWGPAGRTSNTLLPLYLGTHYWFLGYDTYSLPSWRVSQPRNYWHSVPENSPLWGPSCALQDIQQHLWPILTQCQQYSPVWQIKMFLDIAKCLLESKIASSIMGAYSSLSPLRPPTGLWAQRQAAATP